MLQCITNKQQSKQRIEKLIQSSLLNTSTEHFFSQRKERMSSQMTLDLNNINMCGEDNIVFLYVEEKVEIYKKSKGWDNTPLWLKFGRKDGIFQWLKSDIDPGYVASSMGLISRAPIFQKEDTLYWNFILRDSDPSEEQPLCEKIDVKFFSGEDSVFTCFQLNVSWDGDNFRYGCTHRASKLGGCPRTS